MYSASKVPKWSTGQLQGARGVQCRLAPFSDTKVAARPARPAVFLNRA